MSLKAQLQDDMKSAMRTRDKERLAVIRMLMAAVKQREVDERGDLDDADVLAVVEKMVKQRRDAEQQYRDANRPELADAEAAEIAVLENYLPTQLSDAEIDQAIDKAIAESQAESMRDMGKVMGLLKPQLQGQADMAVVSQRLKARLQPQ
ncbi:Yqey domain containing protein [Salinisphaera sp. C84B14]|uniref:GatB/YqeY domain-containing protein n=1 Tax=Salinisphaera sp. C84B14 TaxID=1304155 RepID=UPI0032B1B19D